jgi:hypothetical protein
VGWQAFIASLVQSLAWPAAVITIVAFLHKPIRAVLSQALLRRLKAGPFEVEFDQVQAEVQKELARSPELSDTQIPAPAGGPRLSEELSGLAETAPRGAVVMAFAGSRNGWPRSFVVSMGCLRPC